jgi:hypothetical protein
VWPFKKVDQVPPVDLQDYICRFWRLRPEKYSDCRDVFKALGAAGDDCFEFMDGVAKHFAVDFGSYDWSKFHRSEGEEMDFFDLSDLVRRWFGGARNEPDRPRLLRPISTAHLEEVVRRKTWFDPPDVPSGK